MGYRIGRCRLGGNTWASTYADVPRTLNELGEFCTITNGVVFHNTLASSDYGYLQHGTFDPRPNYFAVVLWNRLMGSTVYNCQELSKNTRLYAHSRKDGKEGIAYLFINNSSEKAEFELPKEAEVYVLNGEYKLRSRTMTLNGNPLKLSENDELPVMNPVIAPKGILEVLAESCTFIIL